MGYIAPRTLFDAQFLQLCFDILVLQFIPSALEKARKSKSEREQK